MSVCLEVTRAAKVHVKGISSGETPNNWLDIKRREEEEHTARGGELLEQRLKHLEKLGVADRCSLARHWSSSQEAAVTRFHLRTPHLWFGRPPALSPLPLLSLLLFRSANQSPQKFEFEKGRGCFRCRPDLIGAGKSPCELSISWGWSVPPSLSLFLFFANHLLHVFRQRSFH